MFRGCKQYQINYKNVTVYPLVSLVDLAVTVTFHTDYEVEP